MMKDMNRGRKKGKNIPYVPSRVVNEATFMSGRCLLPEQKDQSSTKPPRTE